MFTKVTQALAWCSNSVIILQQSAVSAEPSKLAFDNPVPNMKAATYFYRHVGRFLNSDVVVLHQMLPNNAVKRTLDEYPLPVTRQVMGGGHLVPKSDGSWASGGVGR